jgi:hypothetical protein
MRILPFILLATLAYYSSESCAVRSDTATAVAYTLIRQPPQPRYVPSNPIVPGEEPGVVPAEPPPAEPPKTEPPPKPQVSPECDTGVCVPQTVPVRRFGWRIFRR